MKNTILIPALVFLTGIFIQFNVFAETEKTLAERTFNVSDDVQLVIDHEFGTLECKNWDKNEISVTIIARISSDNEEKVQKALDKIVYDISGSENKVNIHCTIKNAGKTNNHTSVSVDVLVNMPQSVSLDINHKFGKGFIDVADGLSKIVSEYGAMTINSLNAEGSKFKVAFGDGNIGYLEGGSIAVSYGKLNLGNTNKSTINSEYSDISIGKAGQISVSSEGGDFKVGHVGMITGKSSFGSMKIDGLDNSLDITTEYGSLIVKNINKDFSNIRVANEFGSTKLFFDENATYNIDASASYGSIDYPESLANLNYREKTTSKTVYRGTIGKNSNAKSSVELTSEYGSIQLIAN